MVLVEVVQETVVLQMVDQEIHHQQHHLKDLMVAMHKQPHQIEVLAVVVVLLLSVKQVNQVQEQVVLEEQELHQV